MAFRSRPTEAPTASGGSAPVAAPPAGGQPCGSLARVLARVFREPKPEILDLGPLCGESAVYFAGRGSRFHVEEFVPPDPAPDRKPGDPPTVLKPLRFDCDDESFDLVLAWEVADFVPPERLFDLGQEIRRVLRVGGWVFFLCHQRPPAETEIPPRYRMIADDLVVREASRGRARRRWAHPNRDIERALQGLSVQGIQLQRSQMREIVAVKAGVG